MSDTVFCSKVGFDRLYSDTMFPNELYFETGDKSHIQILEFGGFNNIHIWWPKEVNYGPNLRQFLGYSPCQAITPFVLSVGDKWKARTIFRWSPVQLPLAYTQLKQTGGRKNSMEVTPEIPPSRTLGGSS